MQRAADWVAGLDGARRAGVAASAGAISVLAFAPVFAWPILFLSFGLLVWLLDGCHARHATLRARLTCASIAGFWFGFGYFLTGLYWVAEAFLVEPWRHGWLIPIVMTALPAGMALFYVGAAALAMLMWRPGAARVLALAIGFFIAEYARGHVLTGLPWNLVGYGLTANDAMMQSASLFGVYALSLIAVLLFASLFALWAPQGSNLANRTSNGLLALILMLALLAGILWGERRLALAEFASTDIRLRIVQADIDQADKWRPENSEEIFADYLKLSSSAPGLDGIKLVIWPETAVPFLLASSSRALDEIAAILPNGTTLLVGSARVEDDIDVEGRLIHSRIFNGLLAVNDSGTVIGSYDKIHLVPFGEYLPFQDFMEGLGVMQMTGVRGGFSEGRGPRRLDVPGVPPFSPLICYEIIFPDAVTDKSERPGWLLSVTNDAWFGTSAGPHQHFHQARLRAVEQGLPVVRAANTGISAIIDPYGRILAKIGLAEKGVLDGTLPRALPPTPLSRWESAIEISVLVLALLGWLAFDVQFSTRVPREKRDWRSLR